MKNLTILNTKIRTLNNLYSLNDLHLTSGNDPKHRPTFFIRNEQTQALINELKAEKATCENSHSSSDPSYSVLFVKNGIGTYACQELVIAYAAWISPAFHLKVIRAFMAMHHIGEKQPYSLPEPPKPTKIEIDLNLLDALVKYCRLAKQHGQELEPVMRNLFQIFGAEHRVKNNFAATAYDLAHEFNYWIAEAEQLLQQSQSPKTKRLKSF